MYSKTSPTGKTSEGQKKYGREISGSKAADTAEKLAVMKGIS